MILLHVQSFWRGEQDGTERGQFFFTKITNRSDSHTYLFTCINFFFRAGDKVGDWHRVKLAVVAAVD